MSTFLTCKFINKAATTAYQKGCRCMRCVTYYEKTTKAKQKERKERNKVFIQSLRLCCVDCGWNKEPNILEFHHETNKKNDSSIANLLSGSIERLLEELDKGVFLCPTCHRMRHFNKETQKVETFNKDLR